MTLSESLGHLISLSIIDNNWIIDLLKLGTNFKACGLSDCICFFMHISVCVRRSVGGWQPMRLTSNTWRLQFEARGKNHLGKKLLACDGYKLNQNTMTLTSAKRWDHPADAFGPSFNLLLIPFEALRQGASYMGASGSWAPIRCGLSSHESSKITHLWDMKVTKMIIFKTNTDCLNVMSIVYISNINSLKFTCFPKDLC